MDTNDKDAKTLKWKNDQQAEFMQYSMENLSPWITMVEFIRLTSTDAARQIDDASLDFVVLDARYDYCGMRQDLEAYYPKLRPSGILAGTNFATTTTTPLPSWSQCSNSTHHEGTAVQAAVEDFCHAHGLVVSVAYQDGNPQAPTWMVQKPTRPECVTATKFGFAK